MGTVEGQERFDGNTEPHGHFICPGCRAVIDIAVPSENPEVSTFLEDTMGFQVDRVELRAYGSCGTCVKAQ